MCIKPEEGVQGVWGSKLELLTASSVTDFFLGLFQQLEAEF